MISGFVRIKKTTTNFEIAGAYFFVALVWYFSHFQLFLDGPTCFGLISVV